MGVRATENRALKRIIKSADMRGDKDTARVIVKELLKRSTPAEKKRFAGYITSNT